LLVYIRLALHKLQVSDFLEVFLLAGQLRGEFLHIGLLATLGRTAPTRLRVALFEGAGQERGQLLGRRVVRTTDGVFEVVDELHVLILALLLFYLAHLVLLHALNNFEFLALLESLLIFVPLLHELLHIVMDILVNSRQISNVGGFSRFLLQLQSPHQLLSLHLGLCIVRDLNPAFVVVFDSRIAFVKLFSGQAVDLIIHLTQLRLKLLFLLLLQLSNFGYFALVLSDLCRKGPSIALRCFALPSRHRLLLFRRIDTLDPVRSPSLSGPSSIHLFTLSSIHLSTPSSLHLPAHCPVHLLDFFQLDIMNLIKGRLVREDTLLLCEGDGVSVQKSGIGIHQRVSLTQCVGKILSDLCAKSEF
jgi:hypothetical protein